MVLLAALALWSAALPIAEPVATSDRLHAALDTLALDPQEGRGRAGSDALAILASADHSAAAIQRDFAAYFLKHERDFPKPLHHWLSTTALQGEEPVREKLQAALPPVLAAKITQLFAERGERLGTAAAADESLLQTVANTLHLLAEIADRGTGVSPASRRAVYDALASLIARYPYFLRRNVTLDVRTRPLLATIRAQIYVIMRDVKPLDARSFVADTGFHGRYAEFVLRDGLLVLDNNCLDDSQLDAIESLRRAIPASLHDETFISVHQPCLGTPQREDGPWALTIRGSRGVNISGLRVAAGRANQFPEDSEAIDISSFCAVLQHELNHVVDGHGIASSPVLAARKRELIERAGTEPLQFLRSQFEERNGGGVFRDAPQEFFASIANQYLADTRQTLELGYERWLQGYTEPLNQFLFFLEVYSLGTQTSLFFTQDEACRFAVEPVALHRDDRGFIRGLVFKEASYEFPLDAKGNVVH